MNGQLFEYMLQAFNLLSDKLQVLILLSKPVHRITMRLFALLLLAALYTPTTCIKLRKAEFNVLIFSRQSLILFTADGCKECDRVQGLLDSASSVLTKTAIASVNCNEEPSACDDAQVFTVPTLKYTTGDGNLVTYKEALDASS